jgi:lactate dehydrogenase-like 2-hydroxyacid dehydrogenase
MVARDGGCPPAQHIGGTAPVGATNASAVSTACAGSGAVDWPDAPAATATASGASSLSDVAVAETTRVAATGAAYPE